MIPYMAEPRCPLNNQNLAIFFPFATIPTIPHYPEFTDRYFPQYGRLLFSLHFMANTPFFDLPSPTPTSFLIIRPVQFRACHHLWRDWQNFSGPIPLSHSTDLGCVGAQRIMFLGRFVSMFHLFAISSSQRAPKGSAERPTHTFLVAWPVQNLLIALPASPPTFLFQFEKTLHLRQLTLYIFEFEHFWTCFFSMFYSFAISSSQCATKGSAEWSTYTFLVARPAHNMLIASPASPPNILFHFEHTTAFQSVHLFYLYTFFSLNMSENVFVSEFHPFTFSLSQCAPIGSVEPPSNTFSVAFPAHNLMILLPALPPIILLQLVQKIAFQPVHFFTYTQIFRF